MLVEQNFEAGVGGRHRRQLDKTDARQGQTGNRQPPACQRDAELRSRERPRKDRGAPQVPDTEQMLDVNENVSVAHFTLYVPATAEFARSGELVKGWTWSA